MKPNLSQDKSKNVKKKKAPAGTELLESVLAPNYNEGRKLVKKRKNKSAFHT